MTIDKIFWLGELVGTRRVGKILIGGKKYAIGKEIPAGKLSDDRLSMFKKAGCIGESVFAQDGKEAGDAKDKDIKMLLGKVSDLESLNGELKASAIKDGDNRQA